MFPSPLSLAASFSRSLWHKKGSVTGQEARAFNNLRVPRIYSPDNYVGLLGFGPDVNLILDPRNGRNGENPTEDPTLGGFYVEQARRFCVPAGALNGDGSASVHTTTSALL